VEPSGKKPTKNEPPPGAALVATERAFAVPLAATTVSALLSVPARPRALLALAHGAGAGMRHRTLEKLVAALHAERIATFRYQFPYMERGRKRPDRPPVAMATVRAAVAAAASALPDVPLFAGGRSFGGRMTTMAAATEPLRNVLGLVAFGFPLHPPKKPSVDRAKHLRAVAQPLLFVQGTRDDWCDLARFRPCVSVLGAGASLYELEDADHGYDVRKRSGRSPDEVFGEVASVVAAFVDRVVSETSHPC
jgi:predicted alpha/beta-hydrolase family hydrolase